MAQDNFQIATYNYYHWSSRQTGKSNLNLRSADGKVCSVWFIEDPDATLPEARQVATGYYAFYYHHHQMASIIDMLRNESPIWVYFNNENGFNNSRISTTEEPVGEGEMS